MNCRRIAILGLGRSGLAIARAAINRDALPVVFDEQKEASLQKRDVLEEARALGIDVRLGYTPNQNWFDFPDGDPPDFVVANPAVPQSHAGLQDAVRRGIEVIGEIEFAYRISLAPIVAITGTNGKSTTTVMATLCLRSAGKDAILCGNIFGSGYEEQPLTDAAANSTADQILVAEISSFQLEWVNGFRPKVAAITNITEDHLNRHGTLENYASTKLRIFESQLASDTAITVGDMDIPGHAVHLIVGQDVTTEGDHLVIGKHRIAKVDLPFDEPHNYLNASVAALVALAFTDDFEGVSRGLRQFKGLAHRMERMGSKNGIEIINNSMCTNPAAVVSSAQTLHGVGHLLIGGINKELNFSPLRSYLQTTSHRAYLFGSDAEKLQEMLGRSEQTYRTMEEAFEAATEQASPGEIIMLAPGCASTDQFRDFRHRGDVFKALAMEWLIL